MIDNLHIILNLISVVDETGTESETKLKHKNGKFVNRKPANWKNVLGIPALGGDAPVSPAPPLAAPMKSAPVMGINYSKSSLTTITFSIT